MPGDLYSGPKFDHANYKIMKILLWIFAPLLAASVVLYLWAALHDHQHIMPFPIVVFLPIFVLGLRPHWQVAPQGLVDLRKNKKKQLIAPYDEIEAIRGIKNRGKTGRVFEVVTPAKTYTVDVLKADEFIAAIEPYVGRDKITV